MNVAREGARDRAGSWKFVKTQRRLRLTVTKRVIKIRNEHTRSVASRFNIGD